MSIVDCLDKQMAAIDWKDKRRATAEWKKLKELEGDLLVRYGMNNGAMVDQAAEHAKHMVAKAARELKQKRENVHRHVEALKNTREWTLERTASKQEAFNKLSPARQKAVRAVGGEYNYGTAIREFLERVFMRHESFKKQIHEMIGREVHELLNSANGIFVNDAAKMADLRDVIRVAGGAQVSDQAITQMGNNIRKALDTLWEYRIAKGGITPGTIKNWMPYHHDKDVLDAVGFNAWESDLPNYLDFDNIIDMDTGLPFATNDYIRANGLPDKLRGVLAKMHSDVVTNNVADVVEAANKGSGSVKGGGGAVRRREHSRFFAFKDFDAQLAYMEKYGGGKDSMAEAILNHIESETRDIALMDMMGPQYETVFGNMLLIAEAQGVKVGQLASMMFDVLKGAHLGRQKGSSELAYNIFAGTQAWMRTTQLGSAVISALSDSAMVAHAGQMAGASWWKGFSDWMNFLDKDNALHRDMLANQGYLYEITNPMLASGYIDDAGAAAAGKGAGFRKATEKAQQAMFKISGLNAVTQRGKDIATLTLHGNVAAFSSRSWDELMADPKVGAVFIDAAEANGVTPEIWEAIRKTPVFTHEVTGAKFIRPSDVAKIDPKAGMIYEDWSTYIRKVAVNDPSLKTKAVTTGGKASGSWERYVASSTMMYKTFGINVLLQHFMPVLRRVAANEKGSLSELGTMLVLGTAMGGVTITIKDALSGKTPRDFTDSKFAMASMLQGGGFGILGDFMFSDSSRAGHDVTATLLGPMVGLASDTFKVTKGELDKYLYSTDEDFESQFVQNATKFATRYLNPLQSYWPTRLLVQRLLTDSINEAVDPKFNEKMIRHQNLMKKQYGNEYWWKPGEAAPDFIQ